MKKMLGLIIIALHAPLASAVYKCVDEQGHALFGDTPPAGCVKVPIYEVTPSGNVLRRIDPTPTPQQVEMQREERERRQKEEHAAAEQRRKDMALLNTYGSASDFDVARDRNIEPVTGRVRAAEQRVKELDERAEQIRTQMASYDDPTRKGGKSEPPAWLTANLEQVRSERQVLVAAIARYGKEIEELRARYDGDKKRWIALKAAGGRLTPEPGEVQPEPVKRAADHRRLGS